MRTTLALISLYSKSYNILPGINKDLNTDRVMRTCGFMLPKIAESV